MYNTELNKIYTNKDFQVLMQELAEKCEPLGIKVSFQYPTETQLKDTLDTTPIPAIMWVSKHPDASDIYAEFLHKYFQIIDDESEPDNLAFCYNATDAKLREGVQLWVG